MVELILIQWTVPIIVLMVAILALESHHLTIFSNVFLQIWERDFLAGATETFEIVAWAFTCFDVSF
jgi:hypothetical protein